MSVLFVVARRAHIVARCVGGEVIGDGSIAPLKLENHNREIEVDKGVITLTKYSYGLIVVAGEVKEVIIIGIEPRHSPESIICPCSAWNI